MITKNQEQSTEFIQNRILKPKIDKTSDEKTFFEQLISSLDKDVRDMAYYVLTNLVNKLFENDEYEIID